MRDADRRDHRRRPDATADAAGSRRGRDAARDRVDGRSRAAESPIALEIDPGAIGLPICRIVPVGDVLVYTARLRITMRVRCAAGVSDEWWTVRPDAYPRFVDALEAELGGRGVALRRAQSE